jgi:hypothetical protein
MRIVDKDDVARLDDYRPGTIVGDAAAKAFGQVMEAIGGLSHVEALATLAWLGARVTTGGCSESRKFLGDNHRE